MASRDYPLAETPDPGKSRLDRLREKALKADKKIKETIPEFYKSPTMKEARKLKRLDKKVGRAVNKYDKIMQRKDREYGAEMNQ